MLTNKLTGAGAASEKTYIEDVFSTYLYTGTGASSQTITNGIDLAGKGGMVWAKPRNYAVDHDVWDTTRGANQALHTNLTDAQQNLTASLTSFTSTGFTIGLGGNNGFSGANSAFWTFRKAPKFFDVVTYTGNGSTQTISHSLGQVPGMMIVKCTSAVGHWAVYHRSIGSSGGVFLNLTNASSTFDWWNNTAPTDSVFTVGNPSVVNQSGLTYVAYLFAHDTTTDGLIQCGSFTTDASSGSATVDLGWEPQYLMVKPTSTAGNWTVLDTMRQWNYSGASRLFPNLSNGESLPSTFGNPNSTGFFVTNLSGAETYIYMAIRRGPMKTPTDATKVFKPSKFSTPASPLTVTTGFPVDMSISTSATGSNSRVVIDRLRGNMSLQTNSTQADASNTAFSLDNNTGIKDTDFWSGYSYNPVYWNLQRAPGFFDVVCYTGTGVARTVNHNLGVAPELMIFKSRVSTSYNWFVYSNSIANTEYLTLNSTGAKQTSTNIWNSTNPTDTSISFGTTAGVNQLNGTYVAYLFASCPGVSKVGSYTGNGSSQTINCGFSAGARFVLIKRTDSTGDWYVWDTARGIVAATDPHLSLNTTVAEVTTDDTIDPDSTGFIVNQAAATNVNVSGGSYIYLAIA